MTRRLRRGGAIFVLLFAAGMISTLVYMKWARAPHLAANADQLPRTTVTAYLDHPIEPGKNLLWCGSFQLAWNELRGVLGETIVLEGDPPIASLLNREGFHEAYVDETSCVALAVENLRAEETIREAVARKFPASPGPSFRGGFGRRTVPGFALYGRLEKHCAFTMPFDPLSQPIPFKGIPVRGFGGANSYAQVVIHRYESPRDFLVEIRTVCTQDRILFARRAPRETLLATIQAALDSLDSAPPGGSGMGAEDILHIPMMDFSIEKRFRELEGTKIRAANTSYDSYLIAAPDQTIRFHIDEKGIDMTSDAMFGLRAGLGDPRVMILDGDYLVFMLRDGSPLPYFACWVENDELMIPSSE